MAYETLHIETRGRTGVITLHRPDAMNAINALLVQEIVKAVKEFETDPHIGCLVITGSEKVFAAGADIKEMQDRTSVEMYMDASFSQLEQVSQCRKPVIAAISGYALGAGCELAMMCDFIIASESAKFGQPEINLGIIPGIGGTQRLARAIGKAKAMEMCMTGRMMDCKEAESSGLVSRIVPVPDLLQETFKIADEITQKSLPALMRAKEAVSRAEDMSLRDGLEYERQLFYSLFGNHDQKEGMSAFIEKRSPQFNNR